MDTTLQIEDAWQELNSGIKFQNISADNLVFVYENTLVSDSARSQFSIHGTPWRVAEHVVQSLQFDRFPKGNFTVYEPFAGAGVFLVTAMRYMRDNLDRKLSPSKRHDLLVKRLTGAEIDSFSSEVAALSLVLADYPNPNGWEVKQDDLFIGDALKRGASSADVILCNPPFEKFSDFEKNKYPEAVERSEQKPIMILDTILDCKPEAIGFVLPHSALQTARYDSIRRRVEDQYAYIELASLPDKIFPHATQESALLIARDKRVKQKRSRTKLVAVRVKDHDRNKFLATGRYSSRDEDTHSYPRVWPGNLWLKELSDVWKRLDKYAKFSDVVKIHEGLRWKVHQPEAFSSVRLPGFQKGLTKVEADFQQFSTPKHKYLDCRKKNLYGSKLDYSWGKPKLLVNAARLSRGPWRVACVVDREKLLASQAFQVIWPMQDCTYSLEALVAIVNGPLFNAFVYAYEEREKHNRINTLKEAPLPPVDALRDLGSLVALYKTFLAEPEPDKSLLDTILKEIDAKVLQAYDLPPRLEKKLLEYFRGYDRPVSHKFTHWYPENFKSCIPLHEYISSEYKKLSEPWVLDVFRPLPEKEAKALALFLNK